MPENQELNEKQMNEIRELKKDYIETFSSPRGKKVLSNLEKICFTNKTTYSVDPNRIYLNEGMRFVVIHIKNMMNMNIETLRNLARKVE